MKAERVEHLRTQLENVHRSYVEQGEIFNDALTPALRFKDPKDREMGAFICSVFAYGKVAHIQSSLNRIFEVLGETPVRTLVDSDRARFSELKSWKHRFNDSKDLSALFSILKHIYMNHGTLEGFLSPRQEEGAYELIERLVESIEGLGRKKIVRLPTRASSFWYLLPRPSDGSACKRMNLFLRWMVGQSEMDLGLWKTASTRGLVIPVDTHVLQQSRKLGLTRRKTADWKTAVEITERLKRLDPEDPTRFDFAICHLGIRKESIL